MLSRSEAMGKLIGLLFDGEKIAFDLVRDVSREFRMLADRYAGIFVDEGGRYWVIWGRPYEMAMNGAIYDGPNTAEDGWIEQSYVTLAEAEAYVRMIKRQHESTEA